MLKNDYYEKIPGWFDYSNIYTEMVKKAPNGSHFVEVGCWFGRSTCFLATEIKNSGKIIRLTAVDHWLDGLEQNQEQKDIITKYGGFFNSFKAFMREAGVEDYVTPLRMTSVDASHSFEDGSLDFVWIDAGHTYTDVFNDLMAWHPKIKRYGVLAGHDYSETEPEVVRAVDSFFYFPVHVSNNSWVYTCSHDYDFS